MSRNTLSKITSKSIVVTKIAVFEKYCCNQDRRFREVAKHRKKVIEFMERDETCLEKQTVLNQ